MLSEREIKVLQAIANGHRRHKTSLDLSLSLSQIDKDRYSIIKKLKANNMFHALSIAFHNDLIG